MRFQKVFILTLSQEIIPKNDTNLCLYTNTPIHMRFKIDDLDRSLKSFPYSLFSLKIKTNKRNGIEKFSGLLRDGKHTSLHTWQTIDSIFKYFVWIHFIGCLFRKLKSFKGCDCMRIFYCGHMSCELVETISSLLLMACF